MKNKILNLVSSGKLKKLISLLFVFGLLKALVYFAPFVLNKQLNSISTFGEFEYSLNVGQTLMTVFSMGFASAYAYFTLKRDEAKYTPIFHGHFLVITCFLLVISIVYPKILSNLFFGSILIGVALAEQLFLSSILKVKNKNNASVIVDTGVYIILTLVLVLNYFKIIPFSFELWFSSILLSLVITSFIYHLPNVKGIKHLTRKEFAEVYKYGLLIIIAGPIVYMLTNNTRLFIDFFGTKEEIGIYSLLFRISSFSLIFYRIVGILLYKKFFVDDIQSLDKKYTFILGSVFVINLILFVLTTFLLTWNDPSLNDAINNHTNTFIFCFFQVTFWINSALLEPIFQRENKMITYIITAISCLLLMFVSLYVVDSFSLLSLNTIVLINTIFIFLFSQTQFFLLSKKNLQFNKTKYLSMGIGVILFSIYISTTI